MLYYDNLEEIIFHKHELIDVDQLIVLSGYVGPQPIGRLQELPIRSSVIYGMYGSEKISERLHYSLIDLERKIESTSIYYSNMPIHSKCYVWLKNNQIKSALIGSANFSVSGLSNPYKEILADATVDTFNPLLNYLNVIRKNSISCLDPDVKIRQRVTKTLVQPSTEITSICHATLLEKSGEVPAKSGLNWGLSPAHTSPGDAYIPILKKYLSLYPNLFPPKQFTNLNNKEGRKTRQNEAVEFIWDDGTVMQGYLEQNQELNGITYPKAICSSPKKNILGIYLRKRLGVDINHQITRSDLERYGRTDIEISLQGEGIYFLNFQSK